MLGSGVGSPLIATQAVCVGSGEEGHELLKQVGTRGWRFEVGVKGI